MRLVCEDVEYNGDKSEWFYNKGEYSRFDKKGNLCGKIRGENVPNPMDIWKIRADALGSALTDTCVNPKTGVTVRLKPTEAVFKIFEHWELERANHDNELRP